MLSKFSSVFATPPINFVGAEITADDVATYVWERANHRFHWLWMFPKVHCGGPAVDASTTFNLHGLKASVPNQSPFSNPGVKP